MAVYRKIEVQLQKFSSLAVTDDRGPLTRLDSFILQKLSPCNLAYEAKDLTDAVWIQCRREMHSFRRMESRLLGY